MAGYHGKMIHTRNMTLAFWDVEEGARVPEHAHHHEQVMHVLEGEFEFTVGGITKVYHKGDLVVVDSNVPHSGRAISSCKLLDVFSPAREDYR
jgi:quercetin dioxygenase-like cupin family protein